MIYFVFLIEYKSSFYSKKWTRKEFILGQIRIIIDYTTAIIDNDLEKYEIIY